MLLRYVNKQGVSREIELTGEPVAIGRSRDAFIPIRDDKVSRAHCGIRLSDDGHFYIKDLKSRNGTFVNGKRIDDSVPLNVGDKIRVGSTTFIFEQEKSTAATAAATAAVQGEMGAGKGYSTILREIVEDLPPTPAPTPAPTPPKTNAGRPVIRIGGKPKPTPETPTTTPSGKKKIVLKLK